MNFLGGPGSFVEKVFQMPFCVLAGCPPLCDIVDERFGFCREGDCFRESGTKILHAQSLLARAGRQ